MNARITVTDEYWSYTHEVRYWPERFDPFLHARPCWNAHREGEPSLEEVKREVFPRWWQVADEQFTTYQRWLRGRLEWSERKRTHKKNLETRKIR